LIETERLLARKQAMTAILARLVVACGLVASACTGDPGPASVGDPTDDPQLPPRGTDDLTTWIAAGHYQSWACEAEAHAGRAPSPHGRNRICSNTALETATGDGAYPMGAAGVKEIYDSAGAIELYAVYRKIADGDGGATWYWFEGTRDDVVANGEGDSTCTSCHSHAPRDFVFTQVTR
jgi:hypothetical protein